MQKCIFKCNDLVNYNNNSNRYDVIYMFYLCNLNLIFIHWILNYNGDVIMCGPEENYSLIKGALNSHINTSASPLNWLK